ncbi:MAG: hypothetical protein KC425_03685 [Anaerolineales bacterium]|nr:hypothetical protein [Anaerolineales bacterium]
MIEQRQKTSLSSAAWFYGLVGGGVAALLHYPAVLLASQIAIDISYRRGYNTNVDSFIGVIVLLPLSAAAGFVLGAIGGILAHRLVRGAAAEPAPARPLRAVATAVFAGLLSVAAIVAVLTVAVLNDWRASAAAAPAAAPPELAADGGIPAGHSLFLEYQTVDYGCAVWEEPLWLYLRRQDGVLEIRAEAPARWPAVGFYGETDTLGYGAALHPIETLPYASTVVVRQVAANGDVLVDVGGQMRILAAGETWQVGRETRQCAGGREEVAYTAVLNHGLLTRAQLVFAP